MKNFIPIYRGLIDLPLHDIKLKMRDLLFKLRKNMNVRDAIFFAQVLINDEQEDLAQVVMNDVIKPKIEKDMALTNFDHKSIMHLFGMVWHLNVLNKGKTDTVFNEAILEAAKPVARAMLDKSIISEFQTKIFEIVKEEMDSRGLECFEEYDSGLFYVDVYIPGINLVVEIFGMHHLTESDDGTALNSSTKTRLRVLKA